MIYKCDQCGAALPGGVNVCPKCGEEFSDTVPPDAEVPRKGFTASTDSVTHSPAGSGERSAPSANSHKLGARRIGWLDPPAPRGAPAVSGALTRALIVFAVLGAIFLLVHFVK